MIRTQSAPTPREDSFDWLSRTLAQVLGTGAASTPLRRDRPLREMTANESAVFADTLRRRYRRVEDARTGRVTFVRAGGLTALGPGGGDPMLERYAITFLPPVREALERIVPGRGRDTDAAEDVAAALAGLREALALYENELRSPPSAAYLRFLGGRIGAELLGLRALVTPPAPSKQTVDVDDLGEAEDRSALDAATAAFTALHDAVQKRLDDLGGPQPLDGFYREVERASPALAEAAEEVRRTFGAIGVAEVELARYTIDANPLGTLADLLRAAAEEPRLWLALARTGSGQHRQRIEEGACAIAHGLTALSRRLNTEAAKEAFLGHFGLEGEECCDDGRVLAGAVARLCTLGRALLAPLCPEGTPPPPRVSRLHRRVLGVRPVPQAKGMAAAAADETTPAPPEAGEPAAAGRRRARAENADIPKP